MTLVILAAGMGSRFGGLKQVEKIDDEGNFIIDYSVYDAVRAGFDKIVFIINEENYELFKSTIGSRVSKIVKVEYRIGFYNDNDDLIHPSDLTLYNKLHIVCHYNENNNHIYSLANIYNNKYFKCLEFFSLHQKVKFGINILKHHKIYNSKKIFFFLTKI